MWYFCKYKDSLGKPKKGLHSYRVFDISVLDVLFLSQSLIAKICFLSTVKLSSCLSRFSNKTLIDFGSLEIPSNPFFSALFKLKILYFFPEDVMLSKDLKEFLLLNFMRYT